MMEKIKYLVKNIKFQNYKNMHNNMKHMQEQLK